MSDRRAALEAAIEASPKERGAYEVLADELQRLGDPRGELISMQLAPQTVDVVDRTNALIEQHRLFPPGLKDLQWQWGYVVHAELDLETCVDPVASLAHPSMQFLRALWVTPSVTDLQPAIDAIATRVRPTLGELWLGRTNLRRRKPLVGSHGNIGTLDAMLPQLPNLWMLQLDGQHVFVDRFEGRLRNLAVSSIALRKVLLDAILASSWPALEAIDLSFGTVHPATDDLQRLIAHPFPSLHTLAIKGSFVDELIEPLARSALLPRLRTLGLSGGLTDTGAEVIAYYGERFRGLTALNLSNNYLTPAAIERVGGVVQALRANDQEEPPDRDGDLYDY